MVHRSVQRPSRRSRRASSARSSRAARGDIFLELPIPRGGIELRKPGAEGGKILGRELTDSVFDLLNGAHAGNLSATRVRGKSFPLHAIVRHLGQVPGPRPVRQINFDPCLFGQRQRIAPSALETSPYVPATPRPSSLRTRLRSIGVLFSRFFPFAMAHLPEITCAIPPSCHTVNLQHTTAQCISMADQGKPAVSKARTASRWLTPGSLGMATRGPRPGGVGLPRLIRPRRRDTRG